MKGFSGIIVLFTFLIVSVILLGSFYQQKSEDNSSVILPKINNFLAVYETNIQNMSLDCNWANNITLSSCLYEGSNAIFEKTKIDLIVSCTRPILSPIDINHYSLDLNCTNKILLPKNITFNIQKRVLVTSPLQ